MKNIIKISLLAIGFSFASCGDLLDVQPRQSINSANALDTREGINASLLGTYDVLQNLRQYGRDLVAIPEALADNGEATGKSGRLNAEYQNQPNAHFANWLTAYDLINRANLIIDALPANKAGLLEAERSRIEGEALFLRALAYFDLMRAYAYDPGVVVTQNNKGGVPLMVKGVLALTEVTQPTRASIDECYAQIYKDIEGAIAKLDASTNSRAPFYASKAAAYALYSRIALYRKDYQKVVDNANLALAANVGRFQPTANYVASWRSVSNPESIFELSYQTNENLGVNESLQTTYTTLITLGNRNSTGGFGDLVPSADYLALFEATDVRRNLYELGTAGRGTARIECTKFMGKGGQINVDNIPVIRISELFLNRAEAQAMLGNAVAALTDLNLIRTRAGLTASAGLTGSGLLEEILKQRRIEFGFEGHRFFDLKRLGRDVVKAPRPTLPYTDFRVLANIPIREVQANPNLVQNTGY